MQMTVFPTKGNLLQAKKSLSLATLGFDLMDRKRTILIQEMVALVANIKKWRNRIETTYAQAYLALQQANITMGLVEHLAQGIEIEQGISIRYRSVMGVEIPKVTMNTTKPPLAYGFTDTNTQFDIAYAKFEKAKEITVLLAEVENSVCRLANEIKRTQRRANALHNIIIPTLQQRIKWISEALDEKEREEFSRLKVIKKNKTP